jgi:hypothetical protein
LVPRHSNGEAPMIKSVSQLGTRASSANANADPDDVRRQLWREAIEESRKRDPWKWDRPMIMLPDDSKEVPYRRASSYGAALENDSNLVKWKMRQVARGVSHSRALVLAITRAEVGLDGDAKEASAAKKELDKLCQQAMDAVGSSDAASIGTSLHHVCERIDLGKDPGHIPEQWRPDIDAYRELTTGFEMLGVERFVVQDEHRVAGTLDRAVRLVRPLRAPDGATIEPGSVLIGDVKTAQSMDFAGCKFAVQCWVYATGVPYDPVARQRIEWGHETPSADWAVIFHVPSGEGRAAMYWVNLRTAANAAHDVREVYAWRNRLGKAAISKHRPAEDFAALCTAAASMAELMALYQRAVAAGAWDVMLKQIFGLRKQALLEVDNVR